jgi:hypothetical protein
VKRSKFLTRHYLTSLACITVCTVSSAQAVYRCGNSYSQTPCAQGVIVQTDDTRSEAQRSAAQQVVADEKKLANALETTRKKDEALAFKNEQAERAAHARRATAQAKAEVKKTKANKPLKKPAGLRTVKVQEEGVFTTTSGNPEPKKTRSKKSPP